MIYHMLVGLDGTVGLGSRVISYSQVPGGKRLEHLKRMDKMARMEKASKPWRALKDGVAGVVMAEGIMGSRHQLEEFVKDHAVGSDGIAGISRIFVLTDQASRGRAAVRRSGQRRDLDDPPPPPDLAGAAAGNDEDESRSRQGHEHRQDQGHQGHRDQAAARAAPERVVPRRAYHRRDQGPGD